MIFLEIIGTATTILAITGVFYSNRIRRRCYYFWLISNSLCLIIHLWLCVWSLVVRDSVFLALACEGLRKWKDKPL